MDRTNRGALFETMKPTRALAVMAVPIFMDPLLRLRRTVLGFRAAAS